MAREKISEKRAFLKEEKRLDRIHYLMLLACAGFGWYYYAFIEPETLGNDSRYIFYVFVLPTFLGMLALGYYRRQFLINRFTLNRGFILWTFMIIFYFIQGVIVSYLSFGQIARVSWDYINYRTAMSGAEEVVVCNVERFWEKKRPAVEFRFEGKHEEFKVDREFIRQYADVDPDDYQLKIQVRKGTWNYYLVTDWYVERK